MSNILALDIATKTGWAVSWHGTPVISGVKDFGDFDDEASRADYFEYWLKADRDIAAMDFLVMETSFSTGFGKVDYRLNGMQYLAHMVAWKYKVERRTVPPTTLKKFATGNGRAKKKDMIAAVREWGFDPQDDNEADALALLTYAQEELYL